MCEVASANWVVVQFDRLLFGGDALDVLDGHEEDMLAKAAGIDLEHVRAIDRPPEADPDDHADASSG